MRKILTGVVLCAVMTGCALRAYTVIDRDMNAWIGKPVSTVIKQLGPASDVQVTAAGVIYSWHSNGCTLAVTVVEDRIGGFHHTGSHKQCGKLADQLDDGIGPVAPPPETAVGDVVGARYVGKPIEVMMARYGVPLRQFEGQRGSVYTWDTQRLVMMDKTPIMASCQMNITAVNGLVASVALTGTLTSEQGACVNFLP